MATASQYHGINVARTCHVIDVISMLLSPCYRHDIVAVVATSWQYHGNNLAMSGQSSLVIFVMFRNCPASEIFGVLAQRSGHVKRVWTQQRRPRRIAGVHNPMSVLQRGAQSRDARLQAVSQSLASHLEESQEAGG